MTAQASKASGRLRIERLYAWITEDENGDEGVIGTQTNLGWIPLVGADKTRMESLRLTAVSVARSTGRPVYLKLFGTSVTIDVALPTEDQAGG